MPKKQDDLSKLTPDQQVEYYLVSNKQLENLLLALEEILEEELGEHSVPMEVEPNA